MTAALEGGEWSAARPGRTPGKDPVPILQEAGWAPGPIWKGGKSRPHRDSIPDRPARSRPLYRLSYPAYIYTKIKRSLSLQSLTASIVHGNLFACTCIACVAYYQWLVFMSEVHKFLKKSRGHVKILGSRRMTWNKFHAKNPRILGVAEQQFVIEETCHLGSVQICFMQHQNFGRCPKNSSIPSSCKLPSVV